MAACVVDTGIKAFVRHKMYLEEGYVLGLLMMAGLMAQDVMAGGQALEEEKVRAESPKGTEHRSRRVTNASSRGVP